MTDEQKNTIKGYVTILDSNIPDNELTDFLIDTATDRVLLYLNRTEIPALLERVIAQVIVSVYTRTESELAGEKSVASVIDQGQDVRFHQRASSFMSSANDEELFTGFEKLLAPYRRVHVITS